MADDCQNTIRFIRAKEVMALTSLRKTKLYDLIKAGDFPKPAHVGRTPVWSSQEIEDWQKRKLEQR